MIPTSPTNRFQCENGPRTSRKFLSWPLSAMAYVLVPNPRPNKFRHSPAFILKRIRPHQPSPEELAASLEEKRVRHSVPTAVDQWIAAGLNSGSPRACCVQASAVPMLADLLEDLVECQLSTTETEASPSLCS